MSSAYFAYSVFSFDAASKILTVVSETNLTAVSVTEVDVVSSSDSSVLCSFPQPTTTNLGSFPYALYCTLNSTDVPSLSNGTVYINFKTTNNPNGELRGSITSPNTQTGASALAIGLGVGLGVGIPLVVGGAIGGFFVVKKMGGASAMSSRGKI